MTRMAPRACRCPCQRAFAWNHRRCTIHTYLILFFSGHLILMLQQRFLGGVIESIEDGCVTEDLQWIVDLHTMRACRMCRFRNTLKIRVIAACPRGLYFLAVVGGKPESPLMHLSETQLKWLPNETKHATRWVGFALYNDIASALLTLHVQGRHVRRQF